MSDVHVLIIKDDCVYLAKMHYRAVKKLLEQDVTSLLPILKSQFLDAGYIVIDLNRHTIVNGQHAFAINSKDLDILQA